MPQAQPIRLAVVDGRPDRLKYARDRAAALDGIAARDTQGVLPGVDVLRSRIERCVHDRTERLQAANSELESFVSAVSHELRGPLRAVNGFTELILEESAAELSPRIHEYLQRILAAQRHMTDLIDALLMLSRQECVQIGGDEIDLRALLCSILDELQAREPQRKVEAQIEQLPRIYGDRVLIRQVFENLLSNAFKYTRRRSVAKIHVGWYCHDGELVFFVKDNGAGFDMDQAGRLFSHFQRLHRADEFEGVGVGLALVRRIVQRHGGRVWAEGERDVGATLYFTLPQSRQSAPQVCAASA